MPTIDNTIRVLESYFKSLASVSASLEKDSTDSYLVEAQANMNNAIWNALEKLLREPPHFLGYADVLKDFYRVAPYNKSVFIMTKFPEGDSEDDKKLKRVIQVVKDSVQKSKFAPRIASDKPPYWETIWGNVEVHLLGCSRGIAIVEDRYRPEFNPNVALEWGWMRYMRKNVLYLREQRFSKERADMMGFIADEFIWDDPEGHIPLAVEDWLAGRKGMNP